MSESHAATSTPTEPTTRRGGRGWTALAGLELVLATVAVARDLWLPTLVLLAMAALSLVLRREGPASLGFHRLQQPGRVAVTIVALTVAWTVLKLALVTPVLEHVTGQRQDLRQFAELQGNWPLLLTLLAVSWTLAAVGEEAAYRGYVLTRLTDVLGSGRAGSATAVVASSGLFALAHTEQGVVGVALTFVDALLLAGLRLWFGTLWAPVLAHGVNNTLGLTAYAIVGPVYGLW
jgi:membrane protease YdiL (CAAX protease family)